MSGRGLHARGSLSAVAARHEFELVDNDFKLAALAAILRLPLGPAQFTLDSDLAALAQEARHACGAVAEHRAIYEVRVIFPLLGLGVAATVIDSHAERKDLETARGFAKLGIARKIARDNHFVDAHDKILNS